MLPSPSSTSWCERWLISNNGNVICHMWHFGETLSVNIISCHVQLPCHINKNIAALVNEFLFCHGNSALMNRCTSEKFRVPAILCSSIFSWVVTLTHHSNVGKVSKLSAGVFLLGWNENLQPHGPLPDQFDTTGLEPDWFIGRPILSVDIRHFPNYQYQHL